MGENLIWAGPRLANTCTSVARLSSRPWYTLPGISVLSCSSAGLASIRAISSATLPAPSTATLWASSGQERGHVRVTVVPRHEVRGTVTAGQVDSRDVQWTVPPAGTGGEDHRVVMAAQVGEGDIAAVVHIADEANLVPGQHPAQRLDDLLDPRVIGRHAVAHQAVGGRATGRTGRPGHRDVRRSGCRTHRSRPDRPPRPPPHGCHALSTSLK